MEIINAKQAREKAQIFYKGELNWVMGLIMKECEKKERSLVLFHTLTDGTIKQLLDLEYTVTTETAHPLQPWSPKHFIKW